MRNSYCYGDQKRADDDTDCLIYLRLERFFRCALTSFGVTLSLCWGPAIRTPRKSGFKPLLRFFLTETV